MYNNELYNYIYKADIQNSIYLVTKLIYYIYEVFICVFILVF